MYNKKPSKSNSRSYLSPQTLKCYQLNQSPRFDVQKALQQQIERKRMNEQKLARYDEYNCILAGKGMRGFDNNDNMGDKQSQLKKYSPLVLGTEVSNNNNNNNHKNKVSSILSPTNISRCKNTARVSIDNQSATRLSSPTIALNSNHSNSNKHHNQQYKQPHLFSVSKQQATQRQKYLQLLKEKNMNLLNKNKQLNVYLNEITSGVGELECILQQVQGNCDKLKIIHPSSFNGLWLMSGDGEQQYKYQELQYFQSQQQKSIQQKDTDATIDMKKHYFNKSRGDSDSNNNNGMKNHTNIYQTHIKNQSIMPTCHPNNDNERFRLIQQIETKFKTLLHSSSSRRQLQQTHNDKDYQMQQLKSIEKRLDQIKKQNSFISYSSKQSLNTSNSQQYLQSYNHYDDMRPYYQHQQQQQHEQLYQKLSKAKSYNNLFSK